MTLSRRHFFLSSLALPALAAKKPAGGQPDILLILVDGLPSWMLGCCGNTEVRTPNIDRLSQTGTRFLNHCVCAPVAGPSRAALLTGRTPMQLRDAGSIPAGEVPLDKILAGQGYAVQTAESMASAEPAAAPGKPFFLTVSYRIEAPYNGLAQKYYDLYAQARLDTFDREPAAKTARRDKEMLTGTLANQRKAAAAVTALDDEVAALLAGLSQRKLLDNTLVIFAGTCGSLLGRHGLWDSGDASEPVNMYEEVVAPPLFWSWPGHVPAQATRPELVSAYDLVPTLCDLTATALPSRNLCGRSYLAIATGKPLPKKQPWRSTVLGHYQDTGMVRVERYKLVLRNDGKGPGELYDLGVDPREKVNQYDNPQFLTVRTSLAAQLARWRQNYS
jgi:arylsulfatase A-like enzyme